MRFSFGEEEIDLGHRVLIIDAADRARVDVVTSAGVVDLGAATDESVAKLAADVGDQPMMMSFEADQLPELAVAVVRGVRIVRVPDVVAATKVCRMLEAILAVSREVDR